MDKLFRIVSVNQLGQGRLSLLPEFNCEIFWDSHGFGYDSVILGKNYRYALPYCQWWMVGTGETFNLPLSMILRMGYGLWGRIWCCWGRIIMPKAFQIPEPNTWQAKVCILLVFGRWKLFPKKFLGKLFPDKYPLKWKYIYPWEATMRRSWGRTL